jgi:hypothetical protein
MAGAGAVLDLLRQQFDLHRLVPLDHRAADRVARRRAVRQVVDQVEEDLLEDRAQRADAGLLRAGALRDGAQRLRREVELRLLEAEDPLELAHEGVLRLDQDADEVVLAQRIKDADHRQPADELGDHPELDQVLALDLAQEVLGLLLVVRAAGRVVPDAALADAAADDLLELREGAAHDEEDVGGVDLEVVLLGVLAAALRRDVGDGPLEDLEQPLLDPFARDVARDRDVLGRARDLVDLVDVGDAALGELEIVVGGLHDAQDDVLDVLADVARLGERGGVADREGDLQHLGEAARQQRLARAGRPDQQDVALLELDVLLRLGMEQALVVVVDGDGEDALRLVLADDVLVEEVLDLRRRRDRAELLRRRLRLLLLLPRLQLLEEERVAQLDALVADVDARRAGDEAQHLAPVLLAEGAALDVTVAADARHRPGLLASRAAAAHAARRVTSSSGPVRGPAGRPARSPRRRGRTPSLHSPT